MYPWNERPNSKQTQIWKGEFMLLHGSIDGVSKNRRTNRRIIFVISSLLKVSLLHGCFSRILNCTNDTKSRENITYIGYLPFHFLQIMKAHLNLRTILFSLVGKYLLKVKNKDHGFCSSSLLLTLNWYLPAG